MQYAKKIAAPMFEKAIVAFVVILLFPVLLMVALLIGLTSGRPLLVCDEIPRGNGTFSRSVRFRTTGRGSILFQPLGRVLRRSRWDELPGLVSVWQGDIRLREWMKFLFPN